MDKFCITLVISSPEIKKTGNSRIGASVSTSFIYKENKRVKEKVVYRLFQEIIYYIEKCLKINFYTFESFGEKFNSLYRDYSFDQPEKVEGDIRRIAGELFGSYTETTCEAKTINLIKHLTTSSSSYKL